MKIEARNKAKTEMLYGWNFNSWFYHKESKVCVCVPQKNGCSSLFRAIYPKATSNLNFRKYAFLNSFGPFTPSEIMELFPSRERLLMVRNPIDRFASLWRDKSLNGNTSSDMGIGGLTPEQLIRHIMENPLGNYHWYPQHMYMLPNTELIPFYNVFSRLGLKRRHENASGDRKDDPEMPVDLILQHYHQDAKLWEQVISSNDD